LKPHHVADCGIFDLSQLLRTDASSLMRLASIFERWRTQQAADVVGTKRRGVFSFIR